MNRQTNLILQWIDWSRNNYVDFPPHIGDTEDLSNITLDGSFNLEELAKQVEAQAIAVNRELILELISCAEDYGFGHYILLNAFAEMLGDLPEEEIEEYAKNLAATEGYNDEDYECAKESLQEFKSKYLNNKQ